MTIFKRSAPYTVLIGDDSIDDLCTIREWCDAIPDFLDIVATDVSDISYTDDIIFAFTFNTEEAAAWFKLRWT